MSPKTISEDVDSRYSSQDVMTQLRLILAHELFANSAVLSNFLKYIVEETLAGNLKSLKEYTIGVNGLGKRSDFNPQIDAIVRIHAGRLRRLLAEYYNRPGGQDKILIEVVKGSYVPVFSERSFSSDPPMMLSPWLNTVSQVTMVKTTIAILPFRNLCQTGEHQFFVDALGEELTRVFSNAQEFAVIGHQSTLKHALMHTNVHAIGLKLNVQYVISGTVMQNATHFRVNVGLIETASSTQIWSRAFDYKFETDFIRIQDDTIRDVYTSLGGALGFIVKHIAMNRKLASEDPIEFDPAVFYYQFHTNFSFFNYAKTRKVLEIVQQQESQMPIVFCMLSELYLWGHILGYPTLDNSVYASLQLARKARSIDPLSIPARFSCVWASLYTKNNEMARKEVKDFLQDTPPSLHHMAKAGMLLVVVGEYDEALPLLEQSFGSFWIRDLMLVLVYFNSERYTEAMEVVHRINATDIYLVDLMKIVLLRKTGFFKEAAFQVDLFVENYSFIVLSLRKHLSNFLLDSNLVEKILDGVNETAIPQH